MSSEIVENVGGIKLVSINDFNNKDFSKSNNFITKFYKDLDIYEIRIINSLLYIFNTYSKMLKKNNGQKEIFKEVFFNDGYFEIKIQTLMSLMKIQNKQLTIQEIENCILKIKNSNLVYIKENKDRMEKITTSFILKYKVIKQKDFYNNEIAKHSSIQLYFDKELFEDIFNYTKVGYTLMSIDINKIKSKIGIGLYEELKRITPLKQTRKVLNNFSITNKFKQIHKYSLYDLNEMFGTDFKFLSQIILKIEIQYKKLLELNLIDDIYTFVKEDDFLFIDIVRSKFDEDDIF